MKTKTLIISICLVSFGLLIFLLKGLLPLICFFQDSEDTPNLTGYTGPIIDAHVHLLPLNLRNNPNFYIDSLVKAMDKMGVVKVTLSAIDNDYEGKGDRAVLKVYQRYPDRVYPFLKNFNPADEKSIGYVENQLEKGPWRGLGEIYLRHKDAKVSISPNHPVMLKVYDLAAQYRVPVFIHNEPDYKIDLKEGVEEMRKALSYNPSTIFIWAHGCPQGNFLVQEFKNLYCEFEIFEGSRFNPDDPFLERYLVGTDIMFQGIASKGIVGKGASICELYTPAGKTYEEMITLARQALPRINQDLAEKIAYRNIEEILKLKER